MNTIPSRFVAVVTCLACAGVNLSSQYPEKPKEPLEGLTSSNVNARTVSAKEELNARKQRIDALLLIAGRREKKAEFFGAKELAINLLGEYRATEAVDFLAKHVSYEVPSILREYHPLDGYPSAKALVKIGNPSIEGIHRRLATPCNEKEVELFAYIIYLIDGDAVGMSRLQLGKEQASRIVTADGRIHRDNYEKVTERFKKITRP